MGAFSCLLVLFSYIQVATCSGKISLKLLTYSNPKSRLSDGSCCEGGLSCGNDCDNYFKICLTRPSANRCSLGYKETSVLGDDSFNFGGSLGGGTSNPVLYGFSKWEGSFGLSIDVLDDDSFGRDDHVDRLEKNWVLTAQQKESLARTEQATLRGSVSILKVDVKVFCDDKYLFPTCEEYCEYTDSNEGHYECDYANGKSICLDGWYGGGKCLKKRKNCTPRDDNEAHFRCDPITGDIICLPGWRDEESKCTQEINECLSSPCINNGNCSDLVNDFNCTCEEGYAGKRCEQDINECLSAPCIYGTCNDLLNNYTCDCREGFFGRHCENEIDECLSSPCKHGSCINAANAFKCQCHQGFSGTTCETDIDECLSSPCKNNATCIDQINAFKCICKLGFTGIHCKTRIQDLLKTTSSLSSQRAATSARLFVQSQKTAGISTKIINKSISNIPHGQSHVYEATTTTDWSDKTEIHAQHSTASATKRPLMTSAYTRSYATTLESRYIKTINRFPVSSTKRPASGETDAHAKVSISAPSECTMCRERSSAHALRPLTSALSHTASSSIKSEEVTSTNSEILTSSKINGDGKIGYRIKSVKFEIKLKGDAKKWSNVSSMACDREICNSIKDLCTKEHVTGCQDSNLDSDKQEDESSGLEIVKLLQNESMVIVRKKLDVNITRNEDEKKKFTCIEQAILQASRKIEKKTSFKIIDVSWPTQNNDTLKFHSSILLISEISSSKSLIQTETPTTVDKLLNGGRGKMLATIIVCHIVAITLLLLIIQWRRNQRSLKRVTPISTKRPLKNINNNNSYNNNNSISNSNSSNHEVVYSELNDQQEKDSPTSAKREDVEFAKPKRLLVSSSKDDTASLLESEANQLETLFL